MTTPTVPELVPNGNPVGHRVEVGERVELGRYAISAGERVIYGQRVAGVVRFLPGEPVVLDPSSGPQRGRHVLSS